MKVGYEISDWMNSRKVPTFERFEDPKAIFLSFVGFFTLLSRLEGVRTFTAGYEYFPHVECIFAPIAGICFW